MDMNETLIQGGGITTSAFTLAHYTIFNNEMLLYVAFSGSIMSLLGTLNFIIDTNRKIKSLKNIMRLVKAFIFGAIGVIIFFFALQGIGTELLIKTLKLKHSDIMVINSLWLMVSIILSWYIVPIMNYLSDRYLSIEDRE